MPESANVLRTTVNGRAEEIRVDLGKPLVDVLREDLGLLGTHTGCRNGDCGACTVLVDGRPFKSCLLPCNRVAGRQVETLDGLAVDGVLHPVQQSYWENNAFQCGFCLAGTVLCVVALLRANPAAGRVEVADALSGNLCRCTGYQQAVAAALEAADALKRK